MHKCLFPNFNFLIVIFEIYSMKGNDVKLMKCLNTKNYQIVIFKI